jgi:ferrochelatase
MSRYSGDPGFHHDTAPSTGVLLVNLGTPDAPTKSAVRRYLAQFLWDPRVVEMSRPLWWLLLHGVILRVRPGRVAHAYESVWTEDGAPLLAISRRLTAGLQQALDGRMNGSVNVALGMCYGNPSIEHALSELRDKGMRRLLVLPLYPQYSATTTAAAYDAVFSVLRRWRWVPELRLVQHYHDFGPYIEALARSIREHWESAGRPDRLMMSFHGIPRRYFLAGDPYFCECQKTGRLLADALQLDDARWALTFQSRFGREEWLQPYTDVTLQDWARQGIGRVDVVCPGFSVDCLETLEEIAEQNRDIYLAGGGETLEYIPALNARDDHVAMLAQLVELHTCGWKDGQERTEESPAQCQARARALGAER